MMNIDKNQKIIKEMRQRYLSRLLAALAEVSVKDSSGSVIISPGLKVVHIPSQYEYTVNRVIDTNDGAKVELAVPESPRFEEPLIPSQVLSSDSDISMEFNSEKESPGYDVDQDEIFIVDEKDFEKNYEVK